MSKFTFLVWTRTTPQGVATLRTRIEAEDKTAAVCEAGRLYAGTHIAVVSLASWDAMGAKARTLFIGPIPTPHPRRGDPTVREVICRICGKMVIHRRPDRATPWPERLPNYHDGDCRRAYNRLQQHYRARRRTG